MALETLAGLMKRVGNFDPNRFSRSFSQRIILQKTVYLLQEGFNINLGYGFSWYVHGPYSPALARDAYEMVAVYPQLPKVRFLDEGVESRFALFLQFIAPYKEDEDWLTLAACILYQARFSRSFDNICEILEAKDSSFTRTKCAEVWGILKGWNLIAA